MTDIRHREADSAARRRPMLVLVVDNTHLPPRRPPEGRARPEAVLLLGMSATAAYALGLLLAVL
jgi:hypothetical protein